MRNQIVKKKSLYCLLLLVGSLFAFLCLACDDNSSSNEVDGDCESMDGDSSESGDMANQGCAKVGEEACPANTDCMSFEAGQTPFPECAIYCKALPENEGESCSVLELSGVCSNGKCVLPHPVDGDEEPGCYPDYEDVPAPECPRNTLCAYYEPQWMEYPECTWICIAYLRNQGQECTIGDVKGICEGVQCVPTVDGDLDEGLETDGDAVESDLEFELDNEYESEFEQELIGEGDAEGSDSEATIADGDTESQSGDGETDIEMEIIESME